MPNQNLTVILNSLIKLARETIADTSNTRSGVYSKTITPILETLANRITELDVSVEDLSQTVDFERKQLMEEKIDDFFLRYVPAIYSGYKKELPDGFKRGKNKRTEFYTAAFAELDQLSSEFQQKIDESPFEGITTTQVKEFYTEWQKILEVQIEKKVNVEKIAELVDTKYFLIGVLRILNLTQTQINVEIFKVIES